MLSKKQNAPGIHPNIPTDTQREYPQKGMTDSQRGTLKDSPKDCRRGTQKDSRRDIRKDSQRDSQKDTKRDSQRDIQKDSQRDSVVIGTQKELMPIDLQIHLKDQSDQELLWTGLELRNSMQYLSPRVSLASAEGQERPPHPLLRMRGRLRDPQKTGPIQWKVGRNGKLRVHGNLLSQKNRPHQ